MPMTMMLHISIRKNRNRKETEKNKEALERHALLAIERHSQSKWSDSYRFFSSSIMVIQVDIVLRYLHKCNHVILSASGRWLLDFLSIFKVIEESNIVVIILFRLFT